MRTYSRDKRKVLRITPHLGGGVGTVIMNYLLSDTSNDWTIATLDYANEKAVKWAEQTGIKLYSNMHTHTEELFNLIKNADIVVIDFWNHPLLYDLLLNNTLPPSRLILFSEISGYSNIPADGGGGYTPICFTLPILNLPCKFIFSTPISFSANIIKNFPDKDKFGVIFSAGCLNDLRRLVPKEHTGFNIGYVGTVDGCKMHPDFVNVLKKINIPDLKIIVVGGDKEKEIARLADNRFIFTGKVNDVLPYYALFDVFAYLLNRNHFGTTEMVLQEAMAAQIVPVVLNNPAESIIVRHNETGLVAENLAQYIEYIEMLYEDSTLRKTLAKNAREYALETFSTERTITEWNKIYMELMDVPKTSRDCACKKHHLSGYELFLESIGEAKKLFIEHDTATIKNILRQPEWSSESKGTAKQYFSFFPDDPNLAKICACYA